MFHKMNFYFEMAKKYNIKLLLTQTDHEPGNIIYEDDFQVGFTNSIHEGIGYHTSEYSI